MYFQYSKSKAGKKNPTKTDQFTKRAFKQQLYGGKGLVCVTKPIYFVLCFFLQILKHVTGKKAHQTLSLAGSRDAAGVSNQNKKNKIASSPTVHMQSKM